jgi:hypothetical protein
MSLEKITQAVKNGTPEEALEEAVQHAGFREDAEKLGEALLECWRDFQIAGVVRLFELLRSEGKIGEGLLNCILKPLTEDFKLAQRWTKRLDAIQRGRTLGEMRLAIRERRPQDSVRLAEKIAASGDLQATLPLVGSVLGTCDDASARQIAQVLGSRLNLEPDELFLIHHAIDDRAKAMRGGSASDNPEREFQMEHVNSTVELAKSLPRERPKSKEEQDSAAEEFGAQVRAILAAGVRYPDRDYWPDIARLLVEFLPRETSVAAKQAGVEQRQYQTLSMPARRAALLTFKRLGERAETVVDRFLALAEEYEKAGDSKLPWMVELLGALRHPKAQPFLMALLKRSQEDPRLQDLAVDALGNIGDDNAVKLLFVYLRSAFGKQPPLSDAARKRASRAISALAKIARNPNAQISDRAGMMLTLRQVIPVSERDLQARAVTELLTPKLVAEADEQTKKWAARVLTEELWSPDQQPAIGSGDLDSPRVPLGRRSTAAELLAPLVREEISVILEVAEPKATRFSGALMALGEVFAKAPTNFALPLLDTMIQTAALYSAARENEYGREQTWDPATETYVALDREPILESLVYAVVQTAENEMAKTGRAGEAVQFLERLFERVRVGDLPPLGEKASKVLFDGHKKIGDKKLLPTSALRQVSAEEASAPTGAHDAAVPKPEPLTPDQKSRLLKQLEKGGLFPMKRRHNKIIAMQQLAAGGALDALPTIIELLLDKDALVGAAAGTALIEYTKPGHPPDVTRQAVVLMAKTLARAGFNLQKPLRQAMAQMNLRRDPCRKALAAVLKSDDNMGLAYELSQIMGFSGPEEAYQAIVGETSLMAEPGSGPIRKAVAEDGQISGGGIPTGVKQLSALDEKRRQLEARRAWIAGGKKGPEPR